MKNEKTAEFMANLKDGILHKGRFLSEEIRDWILNYVEDGEIFYSTDLYSSLQLSTHADAEEQEKISKNVSIILKRLKNEGLIDKASARRSHWRKVDGTIEKMDLSKIQTKTIDIKFPFDLHKYVRLYPKNVVVFGGEKDAGKTTAMLNIIRLNMTKHRINYFNSEMGPEELCERLELFGVTPNKWFESGNLNIYFRNYGYADAIRRVEGKDAVNIIDYLEVDENFYLVGKEIKAMYSQLDKGILIINLQKDNYKELPRGGGYSLDKARLYVLLMENPHKSGGLAQIRVAKNFKRDNPLGKNPKWAMCQYWIKDGSRMNWSEWQDKESLVSAGVIEENNQRSKWRKQ